VCKMRHFLCAAAPEPAVLSNFRQYFSRPLAEFGEGKEGTEEGGSGKANDRKKGKDRTQAKILATALTVAGVFRLVSKIPNNVSAQYPFRVCGMTSDPTCTAAVLPDLSRRLRARADMQQIKSMCCTATSCMCGRALNAAVPYVRTTTCLSPTCPVCSVYRLAY